MLVTIDRLRSSPQDFKLCNECGILNWYENDECWNCKNHTFTDDKVEYEITAYIEDRVSTDGHFCDECEVEV